jgi:uncharacterized membrane protein
MPKEFFSQQQQDAIIAAIKSAEANTSGEIQVHLEKHCKEDVLDRAAEIFAVLDMHKTKRRNGVLFYLAFEDHKFAILGDKGINAVVPANFWDEIKESMRSHFIRQKYTEGLCKGIIMAGDALKAHFPKEDNNPNELPDEISFGKR